MVQFDFQKAMLIRKLIRRHTDVFAGVDMAELHNLAELNIVSALLLHKLLVTDFFLAEVSPQLQKNLFTCL